MNPYYPNDGRRSYQLARGDAMGRECPPTAGSALATRGHWPPSPTPQEQALAARNWESQRLAGCSPYSSEPACGEDVMYGLDSGTLAAGATATITVTPQKRHVPERITLTANVANNFLINDIRSGVEPLLITVGAISAAVFIQDSTVPSFRSVVMEVGMDFSIEVNNISLAAARFVCTVLGKHLPYRPY